VDGGKMKTIIRIVVIFILLSIVSTTLINYFDIEFGVTDYWEVHGVFFLIFISIFPRLTLLFSSVAFGGVFWWLGFFFAPRLLVAILATVSYWNTNKILVIISWLLAIGGESSEKLFIIRNRSFNRSNRKAFNDPNVVEAEFEELNK